MRRVLLIALLTAAPATFAANSIMLQLAGSYTHRFKNGDISGAVYYTTDTVEIVPLDPARAAINLDLHFFNGHICTVSGIANLEGKRLVYQDREPSSYSDSGCRLEIWRDRDSLRWSDGEGRSCRSYCGARGGLYNGEISYRSRRKVSASRAKQMREDPEGLSEF